MNPAAKSWNQPISACHLTRLTRRLSAEDQFGGSERRFVALPDLHQVCKFCFSVQGDHTMSVVLTEKAATEIKRVIAEQNRPELKFVRVGVVGGGCSGFQYSFDFTNVWDEANDVYEEHHGVGIVVDKKSDLYLDGTEIDFYTDLSRRGFTFKNPNAVKSCGCGSSFSA
jgi:iron-sulfur cluster assembly protein